MAGEGNGLKLRRRLVCGVAVALLAWPVSAQARRAPAAEAIVQFDGSMTAGEGRSAVRAAGGVVIRDLPVIRGLGVRLSGPAASRLARTPGVRAVTPNAAVRAAADPRGGR